MARKKPAKKAKKQAKKKSAPARKAGKKKAAARKSAAKRSAARKAARKAKPARRKAAKAPASRASAGKPAKKPNLDRPRKTVAGISVPSSLVAAGGASAAASGRQELKDRLRKHTGSGPALTSGDVDADWESAESVGDEAPGGDNPTPDQDVVDDIGRALGVEYEDDEELQGGAEIKERDRHRWELDPASKDDFEDE
jgi:hypothetical protein